MRTREQQLDRSSPVPLYYQLFLRIRADIHGGIARPGDLLGTEKEIQERYGVSRDTVRKALDDLTRSGHLVRMTGRGTFVAQPEVHAHTPDLLSLTEELHRRGEVPGARILAFESIPAPDEAARQLGCRQSTPVLHIRRLRTADEIPIVLVDHCLAPSIRLEREQLGQSLYETLERRVGVRLQEGQHTVWAGRCTSEEAAALAVPEGDPVLRFRRVTFDAEERPIVYEEGVARGDRYEYSVHLYRRGQS